ncbi:XRE family transcriptional regulator [Burkholderia cenocepacia]|uniref:LexA family protein n=1 Tax=Burkholderia cenocepacia TaxID=95486 RepID=UPI00264CC0A7|nr:XRE family transcriptional regulator [Burkholderia cenocepacia]MDN7825119.1 XRE family transcriptional regulator [Burkholderia cenocepacia]
MPAKPLTPEQIDDAARLRDHFHRWRGQQDSKGLPSTQAFAAQRLGFGQSALSQYLRGSIPLNLRTLMKFSDLFGCKPTAISPTLGTDAARLIAGATELTRSLGRLPRAKPTADVIEKGAALYPLISWSHAAVWSSVGDDLYDETDDVWLPSPVKVSDHAFYLEIRGESMLDPSNPRSFADKDLIVVDPTIEPEHGAFVVVALEVGAEAILRQLITEGSRKYLKALNPAWPDRIIPLDDGTLICGAVCAKIVRY